MLLMSFAWSWLESSAARAEVDDNTAKVAAINRDDLTVIVGLLCSGFFDPTHVTQCGRTALTAPSRTPHAPRTCRGNTTRSASRSWPARRRARVPARCRGRTARYGY